MTSLRLAFILVVILRLAPAIAQSPLGDDGANETLARDPQQGDLRLRGGRLAEEGNVEVFYGGRWGVICDDDWDVGDATVVCRQLGFQKGAISYTTDSFYGRLSEDIWLDNVRCTGHEQRLDRCPHDGWRQHDCNSMEAAGVVCKPNPPPPADKPAPTAASSDNQTLMTISDIFAPKQIRIRVTNGRTPSEGRVEFVSPRKGVICGENWSLREAMVVCRQLGLGYAQQAVRGNAFGAATEDAPFSISDVKCTGDESTLASCKAAPVRKNSPAADCEWPAGVVCSHELPDLELDLELVRDSVYLHDHSLHYLQCAMEENCLSSSAALLMSDSAWYYKIRRLLRFSTKVYNIGDADFLPAMAKTQWQWHQCHMHYHSMEIFSHYDIIDPKTGRHVAEGHKASFCLEDTDCPEGLNKRYRCANYGDQGISPNCWDTYLHDIDCQWIDITDLEPGNYLFKVSVNPEYKVAEKNFSNNAVICDLFYNRVQVKVDGCVYTVP